MESLPDIQFTDADVTAMTTHLVTVYESLSERTLFPGDPVRLFLQTIAQVLTQQQVLIDWTAKQNMLRYATDTFLDHLGALTDTDRLSAAFAKTEIKFMLSAVRPTDVNIPKGRRISPVGTQVYFTTEADGVIPAGQTSVILNCICLTAGVIGNGYLPGQLNQLVDLIPFVASVTNVSTSAGGADREDDEAYRQRIRSAAEGFSVAGPEGAYQYWAKTASSAIVDVAVESPSDGRIRIIPLLEQGSIPSPALLEQVLFICNDKRIRPLTDHVTVAAPTTRSFSINLTYWVDQDRAAELAAIQQAVGVAVNEYELWQKERLGRAINPSELIHRAMKVGALRVAVTSPVYTSIGLTEVAIASSVTVTFGGFEHA